MCIYIYTCSYIICIRTRIYIYIMYVYIYIYMFIYNLYQNTHIYIYYVCVYIYTCSYIICIRTRIYIYIYYVCVYIYIYMFIYNLYQNTHIYIYYVCVYIIIFKHVSDSLFPSTLVPVGQVTAPPCGAPEVKCTRQPWTAAWLATSMGLGIPFWLFNFGKSMIIANFFEDLQVEIHLGWLDP